MKIYDKALTLIFIIVCLYYTDRGNLLVIELLKKAIYEDFKDFLERSANSA